MTDRMADMLADTADAVCRSVRANDPALALAAMHRVLQVYTDGDRTDDELARLMPALDALQYQMTATPPRTVEGVAAALSVVVDGVETEADAYRADDLADVIKRDCLPVMRAIRDGLHAIQGPPIPSATAARA